MIATFTIPADKIIQFEIALGAFDVVILSRKDGVYEIDSDEMAKIAHLSNELNQE